MKNLIKREGILFCIIGPAGSGKTTLCDRLLQSYPDNLQLSVSATSRSAREGEEEGIDYFFISEDEFLQKIKSGEFFEHEQVHGNYYGTLKSTLDNAIRAGNDLLLDIDIKGALSFKKAYPNHAVTVFVVPPSFNVLKERLLLRGKMSEEERQRRFRTAQEEYDSLFRVAKERQKIDYFVINDQLESVFKSLSSILFTERTRLVRLAEDSVRNICIIEE